MMHAICTCPKMTRLHRCSPLPFFAPRGFALVWKVLKQTMMLYGYHSRSFPIACCRDSLFAYRLPQGNQNQCPPEAHWRLPNVEGSLPQALPYVRKHSCQIPWISFAFNGPGSIFHIPAPAPWRRGCQTRLLLVEKNVFLYRLLRGSQK